jgi:hypothetical protein
MYCASVTAAMTGVLSTAAGVIALLDEKDHNIKAHALTLLDKMMSTYWAEIATSIGKM